MPSYINNGTAPVAVGTENVKAGESIGTDRYLDGGGLTLAGHTPRVYPWKTLFDDVIGAFAQLTGLGQYTEIMIQNLSGDTLTITPNGDSANPMKIPSGVERTIRTYGRIGLLDVAGSGATAFQIYGIEPAREEGA